MLDVRVPVPQDIPELRAFLLAAWSEAGPSALGWTGATDEAVEEIATEDFLAHLLTDPEVEVRMAVDAQSILGFAVVRTAGPGRWELAGLIVRERETGKGVGRELLRHVLCDAGRAGIRSVSVKTETFNDRALGFYRHEGFVETSRIEEAIGGKKIPLVVLEHRLLVTPP